MRLFAVLIAFVVMVPSFGDAFALTPSGDDCLSSLTSLVYEAGLDVNETVEIFGCRQLANGEWASATILDQRQFMRQILPAYADAVSNCRQAVLTDISLMLSDSRLSQWFSYDITSGEFVSAAMVSGEKAARGEYLQTSLRGQALMDGPDWLWALSDEYLNGATSYLLEPDHAALAGYVGWYMDRRDAAILAMTTGLSPYAKDAVQSRWGFNSIPWPWELADTYTIDSFCLWLVEANDLPMPTQTPARTTEDQPAITDPSVTVWLSIESVTEDGTLLAGSCFEVIGPIPGSNLPPKQTVCDGDAADAPGSPGVVVLRVVQGHFIVSETQPPSGYQLNSEVRDFWTETDGSGTTLTFVHERSGSVAFAPPSLTGL